MNKQRKNSGVASLSVDIKNISKELFSIQADECALAVAQAGGGARGRMNSPTQLRRFYDELEMWYSQVFNKNGFEERTKKFNDILPFIHMLIAKVAYSEGRNHVERTFRNLFSGVIKQIDTVDDLRNAKLFMEAFLGFYRLHRPR